MKVLLLAPVHDEIAFLTEKKLWEFPKDQLQTAWVNAIKKLGHQVKVVRYTESSLIPQNVRVKIEFFLKSKLPVVRAKIQKIQDNIYLFSPDNYVKNFKLQRMAEAYKPDIVLISGGAFCIFPKTIYKIKEKFRVPVILISGVNPTHGSPKAEKEMVSKGVIDLVIVNDKGFAKNWEDLGAKEVIVLPISALNSNLWRKVKLTKKEKEEFRSDVCFVGKLTRDRQEILSNLTQFNIKIWGEIPAGEKLLQNLAEFYYGTASGEKAVKIFNAAKIVLNLHVSEMKYGGNLRTFEIPGTGSFQLIDKYNPSWFKEGKEIVSFKSVSDLQKKITYYLKHEKERKKIAQSGFRKSIKDHTYINRFKILFSII